MRKVTKKAIADMLRDRRLENGLKGAEVVRMLKEEYDIDLSDKTLYGYETGYSSPSVPTFLALCRIYDVEDVEADMERSKPRRRTLSATEEKLIQYFRSASPEAQELALKMLKPVEEDTALSAG